MVPSAETMLGLLLQGGSATCHGQQREKRTVKGGERASRLCVRDQSVEVGRRGRGTDGDGGYAYKPGKKEQPAGGRLQRGKVCARVRVWVDGAPCGSVWLTLSLSLSLATHVLLLPVG